MKSVFLLFALICLLLLPLSSQEQKTAPQVKPEPTLLRLLNITPSPESVDFVQNKTQFRLQTLPTEQRHPKTRNLREQLLRDIKEGLRMLLSVDEDVKKRLNDLAEEPELLLRMVRALERALLDGNKIYIYGGDASGRAAKLVESALWRPFWTRVKNSGRIWDRLQPQFKGDVEDQLISEMASADRGLICPVKGLEDLALLGWLQLKDRAVKKGDVVIGLSEGGDTPSVIGTMLAALDLWKNDSAYDPQEAQKKLFFVYNNPDSALLSLDRSHSVIEESGITKINLFTGPQAVAGSTRMQATTINTFVLGHVLQTAVFWILDRHLSKKELSRLGFEEEFTLSEKLLTFSQILAAIEDQLPALARLTDLETEAYEDGRFVLGFAHFGLFPFFNDITERSTAFHLHPLDTVNEKERKCWIHVWTSASDPESAWQALLRRPFRGLNPATYSQSISDVIADPYLKKNSLSGLQKAGDEQKSLYDFSYAPFNLTARGPEPGDLGICVLISPEETKLAETNSYFRRFFHLYSEKNRNLAVLLITDRPEKEIKKIFDSIPQPDKSSMDTVISVPIPSYNEPFSVNQKVALKILLNIHSTAVMARLGKVIANTMTHIRADSLKRIGQATHLIQTHVNDTMSRPQWVKQSGLQKPVSYGEANAVLFESLRFLHDKGSQAGQYAEVALSIIHILESLRQKRGLTQDEAFEILKNKGLARYLSEISED